MGRRLRTRSVESVMSEVDLLVSRFGVRELHIVDDTFTTDRRRAVALLRALRSYRLPLAFPNGLRIDTLDPDLVSELARAGTHAMNLGIESGSQRILDFIKKGTRLPQIRETVRRVHAAGIQTGGFFILGFPDETLAEMEETIQFALELGLDRAHFGAFLPLPGTAAFRLLAERGEIAPAQQATDLAYHAVAYSPHGVTPAELKHMQRRAFLRFYLRPRSLLGLAATLRSPAHVRALAARAIDYVGLPMGRNDHD